MKNKIAFILSFFYALYLLCGTAFAESEYTKRMAELRNDPNYEYILVKAYDIKQNSETRVITFKNEVKLPDSEERDSNTYIIDSETIMASMEDFYNLEDFLNGRAVWVDGIILKSQNWILSHAKNETVHFETVSGFSKYISIVEKTATFEKLEQYNIMTKDSMGSFGPYDFATRASMAKILMAARNVTKLENSANFSDVSEDHWANNYIGNAQKLGFIQGFEDGTFRPDENVTMEQVIKMVVCLLGYEPLAIRNGGYPNGYIETACQIGLLENMGDLEMTALCTRQDIAEMMNNALDIPLMMQVFYGTEGAEEYAIFDGNERPLETLISYYFD